MPGPGSGRYTNYTPLSVNSATAYSRRLGLFNGKAASGKGNFQTDLVANAVAILEGGVGDSQMFPTGVSMAYADSPKLSETSLSRAGDPGNPYVPDISSPGAIDGSINVNASAKTGNGKLDTTALKPAFSEPSSTLSQDSDSLGVQSPHLTAPDLGSSPILKDLVMGKSKGTLGG